MKLNSLKKQVSPYIPNWLKYGCIYKQAYRRIYEYNNLDLDEREKLINNLVINKISFAYNNTDFYKDFYDLENINPNRFKSISDIDNLPVITKKDIIHNVDSMICNGLKKSDLFKANTGGSTGEPLRLYRTKKEIIQEYAYLDFYLAKLYCKYNFINKRKIILRGNTNQDHVVSRFGCNLIISSQLLKKDNIHYVVNEIKKFNPYLIHAYPSSLIKFIELVKSENLNVSIPYTLTSSEVITAQQIQLSRETLNSKHLDLYGNSEHSVLALNFSGQYDFDLSYGYTEFLGNRIVSTKLIDSAMPLIRYDCGDSYLSESVLVNKKAEKKLSKIGGRAIEFVFDCDGNKLPVVSLIFGQHFKFFSMVSDFSLVQKKYGFLIIEYLSECYIDDSTVNDARNIIKAITNHKLNVSFIKVDKIRLSGNGKKQFLLRVIND